MHVITLFLFLSAGRNLLPTGSIAAHPTWLATRTSRPVMQISASLMSCRSVPSFSDEASASCFCLQRFVILGCLRALLTRLDRVALDINLMKIFRFWNVCPVSEPSFRDDSDTWPTFKERKIFSMFMSSVTLQHCHNACTHRTSINSCKQEHDTDAISEFPETVIPGINDVAICITGYNALVVT